MADIAGASHRRSLPFHHSDAGGRSDRRDPVVVDLRVLKPLQDLAQLGLDSPQLEQLGPDLGKGGVAAFSKGVAHLAAGAVVEKPNQVGHGARCKPEFAEPPRKPKRLYVLNRVAAVGVFRALHGRQYTGVLVVADGVRREARGRGDLADRE